MNDQNLPIIVTALGLLLAISVVAAIGFCINWRAAEAELKVVDDRYDRLYDDYRDYRAKYFFLLPYAPQPPAYLVSAEATEEHGTEEHAGGAMPRLLVPDFESTRFESTRTQMPVACGGGGLSRELTAFDRG
jgi:hypothetical protein